MEMNVFYIYIFFFLKVNIILRRVAIPRAWKVRNNNYSPSKVKERAVFHGFSHEKILSGGGLSDQDIHLGPSIDAMYHGREAIRHGNNAKIMYYIHFILAEGQRVNPGFSFTAGIFIYFILFCTPLLLTKNFTPLLIDAFNL